MGLPESMYQSARGKTDLLARRKPGGTVHNWSGEVSIVGAYEHPDRLFPDTHPFSIQAQCVVRALSDAGLTLADVDGFATATGEPPEGGGIMAAASSAVTAYAASSSKQSNSA